MIFLKYTEHFKYTLQRTTDNSMRSTQIDNNIVIIINIARFTITVTQYYNFHGGCFCQGFQKLIGK